MIRTISLKEIVIAGELEGNRRDCNTMGKQRVEGDSDIYYKC
jgi:hypothetical protein